MTMIDPASLQMSTKTTISTSCGKDGHVVVYIGDNSQDTPLAEARCLCGAYTWWELSKMLKPTPADHEWARQVLEEMGE